MTPLDNRPSLQMLLDKLGAVPATVMASFGPPDYAPLQRRLDEAIADVEDKATTSFNCRLLGLDLYDGNGTNQLTLRKRPVLQVDRMAVETPILGYTRVYNADEIKVYAKQGIVKVFTYKLAVEQSMLASVDYQSWGSLFPPLPQCVQVTYGYGFPLYDPALQQTSMDGGATWKTGDLRDPELNNWLTQLQEAAVAIAAGGFLASSAGLAVGLATSVSFDGYSRALNPAAFGAQAAEFAQRAEAILNRRARRFNMATIG